MRWLSNSAIMLPLLSFAFVGCGGEDSFAPPGGSIESATEPESTGKEVAAEFETSWQLYDDSNLEVSLDPSGATETTLRARRAFGLGAEAAPLKQLQYRIVTEKDSDAPWIAFPKPKQDDAGHDVFWNNYAAEVTLPQGNFTIQFKIDHGGMETLEFIKWSVEVN